jgi:hypothetical protein
MGSMETRQAGSRDPRLEHKKSDWGHNSGRAVEFGREEARHAAAFDVIRDVHMKKVKAGIGRPVHWQKICFSPTFQLVNRRYM